MGIDKSNKKRKHIHNKIIKSQLILTIVAILIIYFSTFYLSYYTMIKRTSEHLSENLHYINNQLDTYFGSIEKKGSFIASNQELRSFLVFHNQVNSKNIQLDQSIQNEMKYFLDSNLELFNLNQIIETDYQKNLDPDFYLKNEFWYKDFIDNHYSEHLYLSPQYEGGQAMSYIFGLFNFTETELIGFAKFDIPYQSIGEILSTNNSYSNPILILDHTGSIIYSSVKNSDIENEIIHKSKNISSPKRQLINDKYYLINKAHSSFTDITVISYVSIDEELAEITDFAIILLFIILFIIIINILISLNTSKKIVQPINDLIKSIQLAEKGEFNQRINTDYNLVEISELANSYSKMINEINSLVEKNHKINLLKIESELNALQQQINPHFLFNTLELISSKAILENADSTSVMTQKLGNLFRYNLRSNDTMTIKKELEYIIDYLYLQKIRFDDELNISYNIDERTLDHIIPKLTLQPLIENTIQHGFEELGSENHNIHIETLMDNENVMIQVKDNGKGISVEKIEQINTSIYEDTNNFHYFINRKNHIGLRSVNARICLLYGINRALYVKSTLNEGTTIILKFPAEIRRDKSV